MKHALRTLTLALTLLVGLAAATDANAQDPRRGFNNGVAAYGSDMWTQAMSGLRLFTPHRDDCNVTTEVFVKIYENSNSVDFGFCIEKDERAAEQWEDARHTCLANRKRLPEPAEWKYVCDSISGVNDLLDDGEWISNFAVLMERPANNKSGPAVSTSVPGSCNKTTLYQYTRSDGLAGGSGVFRCVR